MTDTGDDGFITLPPGMFDPATFKVPPKVERPAAPEREDIVFMPTVPGAAPVLPPVVEEPAAAPTPPPAPAPAPAAAPVAAPAPPAPVPPAANPVWTLALPEGREVRIAASAIVGRNPAPFGAYPGAELVSVDDTTHSVSKTHAAFEVDVQGLWVHDLNSTNGVWVVNGSDVTEAVPGRRVQVPAGASVELGHYVLTVRR